MILLNASENKRGMYEYQVHPNWKPRASFPDFLSYRLMRLCSKMQKPKSYWTVTETTPFDGEEGKKANFFPNYTITNLDA